MENSLTVDGTEIYEEFDSSIAIATGDLFSPIEEFGRRDFAGVVLTPMCDLAQGKIEWVKLSLAIPFKIYMQEVFIPESLKDVTEYMSAITMDAKSFGSSYLSNAQNRDNNKTLRLVKNLAKILKNVSPIKPSHYYLPGKDECTDGFLVDFSHVLSISYKRLLEPSPLLRLKSPWREQLLNRYINYSSRVGTKDFSENSIRKTIKAFFAELSEEQIRNKMK